MALTSLLAFFLHGRGSSEPREERMYLHRILKDEQRWGESNRKFIKRLGGSVSSHFLRLLVIAKRQPDWRVAKFFFFFSHANIRRRWGETKDRVLTSYYDAPKVGSPADCFRLFQKKHKFDWVKSFCNLVVRLAAFTEHEDFL